MVTMCQNGTFIAGSNQDPCVFQSQGREDTDRAVERLNQRSNRSTRAQKKCGKLLSMLRAKSWPKSTQGANTSGLDPAAVEFLLSWNSMAEYFRFFGICFESNAISIVSTLYADRLYRTFFFSSYCLSLVRGCSVLRSVGRFRN